MTRQVEVRSDCLTQIMEDWSVKIDASIHVLGKYCIQQEGSSVQSTAEAVIVLFHAPAGAPIFTGRCFSPQVDQNTPQQS